LRSPVISGGAEAPSNPAPQLGADTNDLLSQLGYDSKKIDKLRNSKAI
jgi:crotonobetainyl-CoA:carnitine CoA-transferase CaiB-like acyl-CoA transferase